MPLTADRTGIHRGIPMPLTASQDQHVRFGQQKMHFSKFHSSMAMVSNKFGRPISRASFVIVRCTHTINRYDSRKALLR